MTPARTPVPPDAPPGAARFRAATRRWLAERSAAQRKPLGQFFTPRPVRERLLDLVRIPPGARVLDPGAGSGEFLLDVLERQPRARVHGWELDPRLVRLCREEHGLEGVVRRDALEGGSEEAFDLVVGNPPYFEVRGRADLRARFADVLSGRPNVVSMFLKVGLDALRAGGRLLYVVPPSMNNGAYFEALRRWILARAEVERLVRLDDPRLFEGAEQSVMLLVLRKGATGARHVYRADLGGAEPTPLFLERPRELARRLRGMHTLASLGLAIRTGRCVWNQRRADLREGPTEGAVPLVWAHAIGEGGEVAWDERRPGKPPYVVEARPDVGPALVVNRVTGTVGQGRLRAALVPPGVRFVAENHVNVVRAADPRRARAIDWEAVLAGLLHERATHTLRLLTGNTQVSSVELAHLVPVLARTRPAGQAGAAVSSASTRRNFA